jgi:hypothetical protein
VTTRATTRIAACVAALLTVLPLFADADADLSNIVGKQRKPHEQTILTATPLPAAQQQQFIAKLNAIRDALRATPALRDLHGYDWETYTSVKTTLDAHAPASAVLGYIVFPYFLNSRTGRTEVSVEGPGMNIYINDPLAILGQNLFNVDMEAHFSAEPKITGELNGFPVYNKEFVVISKRGQPVFTPVSKERFLNNSLAKKRRELAEIQRDFKTAPEDPRANQQEIAGLTAAVKALREENERRWAAMGKWPERVAAERQKFDTKERQKLAEIEQLKTSSPRQRFIAPFEARLQDTEDELAALSATERAEPAYLPGTNDKPQPSGLAPRGATDGQRIVTLNPELFDASKPRTAVQLIILGTTIHFPVLYDQAQRQLDKATLTGLLD